ncbi:MAG: hypothetical protein U0974_02945 [Gemmatimonadales bacterium]|nr:hypothetical protein [Gemmatimonadales bacterium]MDZ4388671.1 hypothetical protein [Gemmatimonadales bacterium]
MNMTRLGDAVTHPLNLVFLILLLAVATLHIFPRAKDPRQRLRRIKAAPGFLISVGILGTFSGIFYGLLGFNVGDIQAAVPQLLEGMTTAFLSSVLGLALALTFRVLGDQTSRRLGEADAGAATIADLNYALGKIDARLEAGLGELRSEVVELRTAVGGQGDSTLVGQIKLMRQDQADASKRMVTVLEEFAEKVSELGSKALIEALKEVIHDFNQNLTEQFGENFKQLNHAVGDLVTWQDNYRRHLTEMEQRLDAVTSSIERVREAMEGITEAVTPLPDVNDKLLRVLGELDDVGVELEARLQKFNELGERAVNAMPTIEANIERLTSGFAMTVTSGLQGIEAVQRHQAEAATQLTKAYAELRQHATSVSESSAEQHQALNKGFADTLSSLEKHLRDMHAQSASKWQEILREQIERQQDAVRQQLTNFDTTLNDQVKESLDRVSQPLLGLHQKLLQDYTPLLDSVRKIVELGQRGTQQ